MTSTYQYSDNSIAKFPGTGTDNGEWMDVNLKCLYMVNFVVSYLGTECVLMLGGLMLGAQSPGQGISSVALVRGSRFVNKTPSVSF